MRQVLAAAVLATTLAGCNSQLPNHVSSGPGVVNDELTFRTPVEVPDVFEWAREYDIEVVEFVRTFGVGDAKGITHPTGINYNFDGSGLSEEELADDWRLEMAAMTGTAEDVWWRHGRRERLASRTFLSLVETVFLRGAPGALAQAKAHPPSAS